MKGRKRQRSEKREKITELDNLCDGKIDNTRADANGAVTTRAGT